MMATVADPNAHILVVDDFDVVCREVKLLLKKIGFLNVDTACDGIEAFTKLRDTKDYALVISDLTMSQMGGLDLLRSIRADRNLQDLRFIMVTGHNEPLHVVAAKKAGVNGYVIKPFNAETLRQRVEAVLGPMPLPPSMPQPVGIH
jgi:two-component system, chemotaxis family, chemotaxis protein CheY